MMEQPTNFNGKWRVGCNFADYFPNYFIFFFFFCLLQMSVRYIILMCLLLTVNDIKRNQTHDTYFFRLLTSIFPLHPNGKKYGKK